MADTSCKEQIDYVCVKTDEIGLCGTGRGLVWDRENQWDRDRVCVTEDISRTDREYV